MISFWQLRKRIQSNRRNSKRNCATQMNASNSEETLASDYHFFFKTGLSLRLFQTLVLPILCCFFLAFFLASSLALCLVLAFLSSLLLPVLSSALPFRTHLSFCLFAFLTFFSYCWCSISWQELAFSLSRFLLLISCFNECCHVFISKFF